MTHEHVDDADVAVATHDVRHCVATGCFSARRVQAVTATGCFSARRVQAVTATGRFSARRVQAVTATGRFSARRFQAVTAQQALHDGGAAEPTRRPKRRHEPPLTVHVNVRLLQQELHNL